MNECSKRQEIKNDYSWTSDSKTQLRGRMALVYCDKPSEKIAKVKTSLDILEFDTRIRTISEESLAIISQEGIVQKTIKFCFFLLAISIELSDPMSYQGCLAVFLFAKVVPTGIQFNIYVFNFSFTMRFFKGCTSFFT